MKILCEPLPGAFLLQPNTFSDERGDFIKTYHEESFQQLGLPFETKEEFVSISRRGVVRGMHFQIPPHDHAKLVSCIAGSALDVLLDLRKNQPAYGKVFSVVLSAANRQMLYLPS